MIKFIASVAGIGYIKGGGTIAAAVWSIVWYFIQVHQSNITFQIISLIVITITGIITGNIVEKDWGKDSSRVVIDEVAGVGLALVLSPVTWQYVLLGLLLFRFFDIVKPLGIRRMENFPKGWGVMADDLLAGLYSFVILQIIIHLNILS